jgi:hypothetical protein
MKALHVYLCIVVALVGISTCSGKALRKCEIAADCKDPDGRTVCWSRTCYYNIPCNKHDDCYFYGSANVPRFQCYIDPSKPWPNGYGTCIEERIGDANPMYERVPDDYDAWQP